MLEVLVWEIADFLYESGSLSHQEVSSEISPGNFWNFENNGVIPYEFSENMKKASWGKLGESLQKWNPWGTSEAASWGVADDFFERFQNVLLRKS